MTFNILTPKCVYLY